MKTPLACLGILIAALLIGRLQGDRIENLENRIEATRAARTMKASHRAEREDQSGYRTKYARRTADTTSSEVYERLLVLLRPTPGGNRMGPAAALQHREALQEIMQLDLRGIRALMDLVCQSKELAKTWPMQQVTANLCMLAMVDADPKAAFRHINESKGWNRLFTPNNIPDADVVAYVLARMAVDDPQQALDSMWSLENSPKALSESSVGDLLRRIARIDPGLALDAITKLPDARQERNFQSISSGLESDEELTSLFLAARDRLGSRPEEQKVVVSSLCNRFYSPRSSGELRKWFESLGMTDSEKLLLHDGLQCFIDAGISTDSHDDARWIANFMPPSKERDHLIWSCALHSAGRDPATVVALLRELGVDSEQQIRAEQEGRR